jgi:peptidoglycan hydrolase CwlO-like protein
MIYLIIITLAIILADITYFIVVNSKTKEQIVSINTKSDQMFEICKNEISLLQNRLNEVQNLARSTKQEIEVVKQIQLVNSKRIEALENQIAQLRSGTNSRFY